MSNTSAELPFFPEHTKWIEQFFKRFELTKKALTPPAVIVTAGGTLYGLLQKFDPDILKWLSDYKSEVTTLALLGIGIGIVYKLYSDLSKYKNELQMCEEERKTLNKILVDCKEILESCQGCP